MNGEKYPNNPRAEEPTKKSAMHEFGSSMSDIISELEMTAESISVRLQSLTDYDYSSGHKDKELSKTEEYRVENVMSELWKFEARLRRLYIIVNNCNKHLQEIV